MPYTTEFFTTSSGRSPVEEFLDSLDLRTRQKFLYTRSLLEEFGVKLSMPFCKYLQSDIYELRFTGREGALRVLYFFIKDDSIVFTNGFLKKTRKAPRKEIELAINRRKTFLEESL
ncbi:MAG: type II toxin-antitoxin system RelE/ParE family toxin [Candidatus Omnitrophica bacterium]|nr:type II toxin-antitoxin system RelE/ParE family toxin [Candidatus Omnitrophota bacterium]